MNVALRQRMDLAAFLAWEERQELRYEFDGSDVRAMVGVTRAHAIIRTNLIGALRDRLRRKPCRPFGSELPEIDIELALSGLYEGLDLSQAPSAETA